MSREKVKLKLNPIDYSAVELTESCFKEQYEGMLEYYLALPNDDILMGFRRRAGLPTPGKNLGGWYENDGSFNVYEWDEIFNPFGQWLSLFGRAFAISGDQRIYEKAAALLEEWGKTIESDGYFFYSWDCNAYHYSYEKIQGGLTDLYIYANMDKAKELCDKITDWAEKNLHRTRYPASELRDNFTGGDPKLKLIDNEWYTLSENLYRMYVASGDERYKNFAKVWHYDYYWDALRYGNPELMNRVHGYSHVNTLGGAAYAYRVYGNEAYLQTLTRGYEILKKYQLMASGGYAFDEHMATPEGSNYEDVENIGKSFEVPCGSWAAFKMVRHLISLTGEARYGDWAETILYNSIGAALQVRDDNHRRGKLFYYADYRIGGGRKVYYEHSYPCCAGTYPQALAEYYNLIYYVDSKTIYLTQYFPSKVKTEVGGKMVELEVFGNYPEDDTFEVRVGYDGTLPVALRVPSWVLDGAKISVNGEQQSVEIVPDEWVVLERNWSAGDVIKVTFPMGLRTYPISLKHPERAALMYGPVLLASEGRHWTVCGDIAQPDSIANKTGKLEFKAKNVDGNELLFRPLWTYEEKEWYTVYHDFFIQLHVTVLCR